MSTATFTKGLAPATPPAGKCVIYFKSDGRAYWKDEAGLETPFKTVGAGFGDLLSDGSVPLVSDWPAGSFKISANQFESIVVSGTAPFVVASNTLVTNLNADKLDGADLIDEDNMASNSDTAVPTQQSVKAYVDSIVAGGVVYKGAYNANANIPDLDTAPSGVIKGDMYTVTVPGIFFTIYLEVGDVLIAEADSAATEAEWTIVQGNFDPVDWKSGLETGFSSIGIDDLANSTKLTVGNLTSTFSNYLEALKFVSSSTLLITRDVSDSIGVFCGGDQQSTGFAVVMYGSTHATQANDCLWRAAGITKLAYDHSANLFDFQAVDIVGAGAFKWGGAFNLLDSVDNTKELDFDLSGITTATVRTLTIPDADVDLGEMATQADRKVLVGQNLQTGTAYELVLADAGKMVEMNNAAANVVTIPANASVAFPVNTIIDLVQYGAGAMSVAITTDTLRGDPVCQGQYKGLTLWKRAATEWVVFGGTT